ncbi:MAG: hypothetical protein AVDCRST_MAG68-1336, partial [uncultured Gemmatimonadetes bacterium]
WRRPPPPPRPPKRPRRPWPRPAAAPARPWGRARPPPRRAHGSAGPSCFLCVQRTIQRAILREVGGKPPAGAPPAAISGPAPSLCLCGPGGHRSLAS